MENHKLTFFSSRSLNGRILLLLLTIAFLTLFFASLPLFFSIAGENTALLSIDVLTSVLVYGLLSLAVTLPCAAWLIRKKILNPFQEMLAAARKVAGGDLEIWETNSQLSEMQDLSQAIQSIATHLKTVLKNIINTSKTLSVMSEAISTNSGKINRGAKNESEALEIACSSIEELNHSTLGIMENVESLSNSANETSSSILEMTASIDEVANSTGLLSGSVEETTSSIFEMAAALKQISEGVGRLSTSSEDLVSTIAEIDMSIREVAAHAKDSAQIAENVATDAAEMGMMSVVDTIDGMDQIEEAVDKSVEIVTRLHLRSEEIGRILIVIHEVSEQTELLSLNASILAAQAGEHGKGFAVVASEIKALAERTATSTKEITRIIKAVQSEAKDAVESIKVGKEKAEQGKLLSLEAGEAIKKVMDSARKSEGMAREIERTTVEQSKGIVAVRNSVDHISSMIEQILKAVQSQEIGSESVQMSAEQINDLTRQVKNAMSEQAMGGHQISGAIENVLNQVQQIKRSIKEQKTGSELIFNSIENIRKSTQGRAGISSELNSSIRSLMDEHTLLKELVSHFKTG